MELCYRNFINAIMRTTGLGIEEMQTFTEWISNRKNDFEDQATRSELLMGFENWLISIYVSR